MSKSRHIAIVLPDLGAGDQPVRFAQWLVKNGETVLEQDRVAEVVVGGVLFHVTSPAEGTLRHLVERAGAVLGPDEMLGFVVAIAAA
ncbi:MAG: biotin/lipoyl-containing protein [Planctomycetaceae bacterium]